MNKTTSLWLISALMSSILQAHAGRPSSPAPAPTPEPQQSPAPANTPDTNPSSPTPATTPQGSGPTTVTDNTSTTPQPGFLSTSTGQATAIVGGLATLGVGAVAAKKGIEAGVKKYKGWKAEKAQQEAFKARVNYLSAVTLDESHPMKANLAKLVDHLQKGAQDGAYFNDIPNATAAHKIAEDLLNHEQTPKGIKEHLEPIIAHLESKVFVHFKSLQ
jgi:hypothetical protein